MLELFKWKDTKNRRRSLNTRFKNLFMMRLEMESAVSLQEYPCSLIPKTIDQEV